MKAESPARQPWCLSHRADPAARALADRHYNRQKIGSPQFVPPGRCAVFLTDDARAFWITSAPFAEYVKHEWAGAWVCSAFRNEGAGVAGDLIWAALAASRAALGEPPALGLVSFINEAKVRPTMVRGKPVYGWTWLKRGFRVLGRTKGGLLAVGIAPQDMPPPLRLPGRGRWLVPLYSTRQAHERGVGPVDGQDRAFPCRGPGCVRTGRPCAGAPTFSGCGANGG